MKNPLHVNVLCAKALYKEPDRSLFYRKAYSLRTYYEHCDLPPYRGESLYPSGAWSYPKFTNGMAVNRNHPTLKDTELSAKIKGDFFRYASSVPAEHTVAGNMYTHSVPNYERIITEGFSSYIPRIQKIADADLREGLLHLLRGIETYITRCVQHLQQTGAEERLVSALKKVPMEPAATIYEAIVAWNFVLYLDGCDNLGCVASGLCPFYHGEDVTNLLRNLYDNLDANDGYSMALGTDYNPLTLQCLEAAKGKRRPMIELFVDESTPEEIWNKAFEVVKSSGGQPAFYNPHVLLKGLQNKFQNIRCGDLKKFCGGGCTESMLAGLSNVGSLDAGINLLLLLETAMKNDLETAESFAAFYDGYINLVKETVETVTENISKSQMERAKYNPLPMRTLLVDDCIDCGLDFNNGGARYKWSIINFAGMINVIDSMLVIKDLVFGGKITAGEMLGLLAANDTAFLKKLRNHPVSFGKDDAAANQFSNKLSADIFSLLDHKKPAMGEGFLPASIQFMSQAEAGEKLGATPDGREAGAPLCDSLAAIFGKDTKGATALLNSVTSLDLKRALGVPVLNFNISPDFSHEILKTLILGYMKQGGIQLQITCLSREMLEEAYRNPDDHKNLVVRVGGYSEYFYRLDEELRRMVVCRTIQVSPG